MKSWALGLISCFVLIVCDGNGRSIEALIATEQGIGLYAPTEPHTRWEYMTEAPPAGVGVIKDPSKGPHTIIYGRQDGYLFMLKADRTPLNSTIWKKRQ